MLAVNWQQLRPLPQVHPWSRGQRSYTWEQRLADYAALPKGPLVIVAEMATPVVHAEDDRTHLDGLLSAAALTDHPHPSKMEDVAVVPLPLDLVWVSGNGLPLWACTPLMPLDASLASKEYWHKRYPSHRAEMGHKQSAVTTAGRWREYRVPMVVKHVASLAAIAIGNVKEVERLLSTVTHIGKKTSIGYGRVAKWTVTPSEHRLEDILSRRVVPVDYYQSSGLPLPDRPISPRRAWTPPYWHATRWADCVVPA